MRTTHTHAAGDVYNIYIIYNICDVCVIFTYMCFRKAHNFSDRHVDWCVAD